ncbi:hypothetical protein GX51_06964 [Blastomyces parvus]|uniref:Uncharacterized protein n=1 Tax=Blastomyces parvus TaxID=2060905 RepID=A0A2B7WMY4_9EURO|nr:hypothetical protein GX51_06964 [Blastomyces parvus]
MASPGPNRPKLFARDIISYTDSELDQYIKDNNRIVTVEDPQNLTEDFIQRLRDYVRRPSKEPQSQPVDLDQVTARLLQNLTNNNAPPAGDKDRDVKSDGLDESDCAPTPVFDPEKSHQRSLREQTAAYHALIKAGGRPSHPLSLLVDILKDPGEYADILSYWQLSHGYYNDWPVFGEQLSRWKGFLRLQEFARGQSVHDNWRHSWDDLRDSVNILGDCGTPAEEAEMHWESYFEYLKEQHPDDEVIMAGNGSIYWDDYTEQDTPGTDGRFSIYAHAIKQRLTRHGFTRTIELDEDLTRQDKLTTWAEYLAFEYYIYEVHEFSEAQQQFIDDAWKKLVESKVLSPTDTQESLCSAEASSERWNRLERAEKAVESAKHALARAKKTASAQRYPHKVSAEEPPPDLLKAQQQLNAVEKEYASIKKRHDPIVEFVASMRGPERKKEAAERHGKLAQWVLQQFPLIERELEQANATEPSRHNNTHDDNQGDIATAERDPAGKRSDPGEDSTILDQIRTTASASQPSNRRKRNHDMTDEAASPSKPARRSGRNRQLSSPARIDPATAKNDDDMKALTPNKVGRPSRRGSSMPNPKTSALGPGNSSTEPNPPLRRSARIAQREQQRSNTAISSSSEMAKPDPGTRKPRQAPTDPINTKTHVLSKRGTSKPQRRSKKKG